MPSPNVLHVLDHDHKVNPHDMFVSRGADVIIHLDREDGTVDMWRIRDDQAESLGVARSLGDCGCP